VIGEPFESRTEPFESRTEPFESRTEELALPPPTWSQELAAVEPPLPASASLRGFLSVERRVTALAEAGRADEATRVLEEVLAEGDDDVLAMLALGHVHLRRHAFDAAIEMYARVQAHDPLLPEGHLFEGVAQRKRGSYPEARRALQRVLFLEPTSWPASYLLAGTLERLGKLDEAAREGRRALRLLEEHGGRATSSSTSSLALGMSLLPDPEACLERLRAGNRYRP
jgi:tetratricopeptide (TPR) repeat protein